MASSPLVPRWAQDVKGSEPLLGVGLALAAISVQATPDIDPITKPGILNGFVFVFEGGQKVCEALFRARYGHKMDTSLAPISRAMTALVMVDGDLGEVEALRRALPTALPRPCLDD